MHDGIPTTLIADNMAGHMMATGQVDLVVVGADRIAANGDVANKIGTYSLAVLARENGVPFYVAAPVSTFDLSIPSGDRIPIEERAAEEVTHHGGRRLAPEGVTVRNPAFDVTPHRYVTAIVCERGVARPPYTESLRAAGRRAMTPPARHRDLLRRDRGRGGRGRPPHPLQRRLHPGRRPRALRRRGARAGVAPSPREHLPRGREGDGRRRARLRGPGRGGGDPGPRPRGLAARRRGGGQGHRVDARQAARPRPPHRRAHRGAVPRPRARCRCPRSPSSSPAATRASSRCAERGDYRLLARTRDDAAGEAFDKVAKLLGLGYPGRPGDRPPRRGRQRPRARVHDRAAQGRQRRLLVQRDQDRGPLPRAPRGHAPAASPATASPEIRDLVASFQRAVVAALVRRMREVALARRPKTLLLTGGVAANRVLRREAARAAEELGLALFMPPIALSTDNAAMIAAAGFVNFDKGLRAGLDLDADPHLPL